MQRGGALVPKKIVAKKPMTKKAEKKNSVDTIILDPSNPMAYEEYNYQMKTRNVKFHTVESRKQTISRQHNYSQMNLDEPSPA